MNASPTVGISAAARSPPPQRPRRAARRSAGGMMLDGLSTPGVLALPQRHVHLRGAHQRAARRCARRSWSCSTTWRRSTAPRARGATSHQGQLRRHPLPARQVPHPARRRRARTRLRPTGDRAQRGRLVSTPSQGAGDARYAIPGRFTTAYLLLRLALGFEPKVGRDALRRRRRRGEERCGRRRPDHPRIALHLSGARRVGRVARPWSVVGA